MRPKNPIRKRFDVQEPGKSATFSSATALAAIGGASGNLYFVGLEGSGRRSLARAAAPRLGLAFAEAATRAQLDRALAGKGLTVAVTGDSLLLEEGVAEALRASGKVFYLMSVAPILARRLGDLSRLEELAARVERMEPVFFGAAHFILPLASSEEEMLEDVAEKASL
ncbi:hypothetical protein NNJEOMEG_00719 [Fundidesulfovibrio magnetotacticus]|uniref:Uncharacterized protein n=1 Tax=Fundidesulfovibrio magnetotacticus TaxID=2730080 RepID=A0A6V8LQQ9_9BACT|nr:hypothetical protein [Fundidesulfovibrio magnetotacticus]GFK92891.1 hypothetical protein NNJEOMEG_00719 [Fundidesulfovibrio magnetotacticus]